MAKKYELTKEAQAAIAQGKGEFAKGSKAIVTGIAGVILALQIERIALLSVDASIRPTLAEVKEMIRDEFGGLTKEGNRQAYDACSLAFRIHAKLNKESDSILSEGIKKGAAWLEGQVSSLAGRATADAWKAWIAGPKKEAVKKSPSEQLLAYVEKKIGDIEPDALEKVAAMIAEELAKRERVAQEIKEANAA